MRRKAHLASTARRLLNLYAVSPEKVAYRGVSGLVIVERYAVHVGSDPWQNMQGRHGSPPFHDRNIEPGLVLRILDDAGAEAPMAEVNFSWARWTYLNSSMPQW